MGRKTYTTKQFIDAIPGSGGIITAIARRIGCDWHTAKKYITIHSTVAQAYEAECESVLDLAETSLIKSVREREAWAVKYLLATKGKGRGYTERQEITGADGGPMIVVNWDAADKD